MLRARWGENAEDTALELGASLANHTILKLPGIGDLFLDNRKRASDTTLDRLCELA